MIWRLPVLARRAGSHYVPRILKGAKPGDLPVEMPTKYELVISVVAAKALGLEPGHCAGERFYDLVRAEMPNKVIRSAVGTRFVFGA
jgi:hypothetical protein